MTARLARSILTEDDASPASLGAESFGDDGNAVLFDGHPSSEVYVVSDDSQEFYLRPLLRVGEVSASVAYYCEKLGFTLGWQYPESEPIIAQVGRGGVDVILDSQSSLPHASVPTVLSLSLHESDGLNALYEEFTKRGARTTSSPTEVTWQPGIVQMEVRDLDDNVLLFWGDAPGS